MKNSLLMTALLVAVCAMAFVVLILAIGFEYHYWQLRRLRPQVAQAENNRNLVNALANDALEYSKHNPAIDPILQSVGVKPGQPLPAANGKPAGK